MSEVVKWLFRWAGKEVTASVLVFDDKCGRQLRCKAFASQEGDWATADQIQTTAIV